MNIIERKRKLLKSHLCDFNPLISSRFSLHLPAFTDVAMPSNFQFRTPETWASRPIPDWIQVLLPKMQTREMRMGAMGEVTAAITMPVEPQTAVPKKCVATPAAGMPTASRKATFVRSPSASRLTEPADMGRVRRDSSAAGVPARTARPPELSAQ